MLFTTDDLQKYMTTKNFLQLINVWEGSELYKHRVQSKAYYHGNNVLISEVRKQIYTTVDSVDVGGKRVSGTVKQDNPYCSNNKISNGIYADIVNQPVTTLLNDPPIITFGDEPNEKFDEMVGERFGFNLREVVTMGVMQGVAYMYPEYTDKGYIYHIFDSENTLEFINLESGSVEAVLKYVKYGTLSNGIIYIIEIYTPKEIYRYVSKNTGNSMKFGEPLVKYYITKNITYLGTTEILEDDKLTTLPIFIFRNNKNNLSELKQNIKSKIDSIDIVNSDFANNLADFQDVYLMIKNADAMTPYELTQFMESIKATKTIRYGDDGDAKIQSVEVPHVARKTFIDEMFLQLYKDTGIVDYSEISGRTLTNLALNLATKKLLDRISILSNEVREFLVSFIDFTCKAYNIPMEKPDIKLNAQILYNNTENLDNALKMQPFISEETFLIKLQEYGFIDDVEEEQTRLLEDTRKRLEDNAQSIVQTQNRSPNGGIQNAK